jgi:hypothetical protein
MASVEDFCGGFFAASPGAVANAREQPYFDRSTAYDPCSEVVPPEQRAPKTHVMEVMRQNVAQEAQVRQVRPLFLVFREPVFQCFACRRALRASAFSGDRLCRACQCHE